MSEWELKVGRAAPKCESSRNVIDQPAIKTYPFPLTLETWKSKKSLQNSSEKIFKYKIFADLGPNATR